MFSLNFHFESFDFITFIQFSLDTFRYHENFYKNNNSKIIKQEKYGSKKIGITQNFLISSVSSSFNLHNLPLLITKL